MQKYILKPITAFLFLLPLTALAQTNTTYIFRFMAQGDMFLAHSRTKSGMVIK